MISHKHKCIFVHIPKVAGVSVEQVFLDDLGLNYNNRGALLLGVNPNAEVGPPRISHLTGEEFVAQHYISQELFSSYFKFAVVRHPYDRVYSFYKYLGFDNLVSYRTFVIHYLPLLFRTNRFYYFIQPMYNYVYSKDGSLLVDQVLKLENIEEDFGTIIDRFGFKITKLPHNNNSKHMSTKGKIRRSLRLLRMFPSIVKDISKGNRGKELNEAMKKSIFDCYAKDFVAFDYDQ